VVEVLGKRDLGAQELAEPLGHGSQRELGLAALGPAEVGEEQQARASLAQRLDGRERRTDAGVVGHPTLTARARLEGHVEVDPEQDPLSLDLQVVEGPHSTLWSRSTQRFE
jgi:hypothetical protein